MSVKAIQEALADDDMREALRCADAKLSLARDSKAGTCLPALSPRSQAQPVIAQQEPDEEEA